MYVVEKLRVQKGHKNANKYGDVSGFEKGAFNNYVDKKRGEAVKSLQGVT